MQIKQVYQIGVSLYKVITNKSEVIVIADTSDEAKSFIFEHSNKQSTRRRHMTKKKRIRHKSLKELDEKIRIKEQLKAEMRARLNNKYPTMNFHEII